MVDVMNGSQVSAPPPMKVTFAEDYPGGGCRLVDERWPSTLLVTGKLIDLALRGKTRHVTAVRESDSMTAAAILSFTLENAAATYRQADLRPETAELWQRDIYEFDCVSCSRDVTDA